MIYFVVGIISVFLLLLLYTTAAYNGLIKKRNLAEEAFSTMDVYLKKRWDLIPNLVDTVKAYAGHEIKTLEQVTALRASPYDRMDENQKINLNQQLTDDIAKIMLVAESYPDLKANQNFSQLSLQLTKIEEDIANARKYYNGSVRNLNNKIQMFPSNIIAKCFHFSEKKMFEAQIKERENIKVDLS